MSTVIENIKRRLTGKSQNSVFPRPSTFEELEQQVRSMDGLSLREIDEKLGVHTSNRNASGSGYLSPRFYKRIPVETPEQKRKREEKVARILRRKD